ncbi:MAG: alpha/beta hydrolase [Actinomycetales bacterium]
MPLQADGLTFPIHPSVVRTPVRYRNRFGVTIAADLYQGVDLDTDTRHPAIVIGPPHGGVKEQSPGVYANQLAQRGFVALAFDPSYNGESSGEPRHVSSPEVFAEDFSAGVDYLGTLPYVDRARIGVVGICGSGGFALSAAAVDPRIRAVTTSALVDISGLSREGFMGSTNQEARTAALADYAAKRWADVDSGEAALNWTFPAVYAPDELDPITAEFHEYYVQDQDRGWHPRSIGGFTNTSWPAHIHDGPVHALGDLGTRPVLLITGEQAHSRWFSDVIHEQASVSELVVVPGARHIDLYDRTDLIPFDQISAFFAEALS